MEYVTLDTQEEVRIAADTVRKFIAADSESSQKGLDAYLAKLGRGALLKLALEFDPDQDQEELKEKKPTQLRMRINLLACEEWERDQRC